MCGRFTLAASANTLADLFGLERFLEMPPRYNIAPSQPVAAVRAASGDLAREATAFAWGLLPAWAKDPAAGARPINARAETAAEKPFFRAALRYRRCLIPADGYYEWQRVGTRKQPHYIHLSDGAPFAMAGLWEHWEGADGSVLETCAILTTTPNDLMKPLHDRMPVIIAPADYARWLDPDLRSPEALRPLLRPYPSEEMAAHPVSLRVNNPSADLPELIERHGNGLKG